MGLHNLKDYEAKVATLKRVRDNAGGWVNVAERVKELEQVLEAFQQKQTIMVSKSIASGTAVSFMVSSLGYAHLQKVLEDEMYALKARILGCDPLTGSYKNIDVAEHEEALKQS